MGQYRCGEPKPRSVILNQLRNRKIRCITGGTAIETLLGKLTALANQEGEEK